MRTDAFNIENRLIEVRDVASGQPLMRSRYDGLSRRRERVQWVNGVGSTNRYVYDNWNVVRVLDGADTVVESYVHGPDLSGSIGGAGGIGGILSVAHEGEPEPWRFYHADGNGNVVLLTDGDEQETARLEYDPFGRVLINTSSEAVRYQFSSKEYETTVGLNYYGYRFYSAGLGRWVNRDPIGERGGSVLYTVAANDIVNNLDYLGLLILSGGGQLISEGLNRLDDPIDCPAIAASRFTQMKLDDKKGKKADRDKWYHCVTSCEIADRCGKEVAETMGNVKEEWFSDDALDSAIDQQANADGRDCSDRCDKKKSCVDCCEDLGYEK
jgi:RHS repeat-associated protein